MVDISPRRMASGTFVSILHLFAMQFGEVLNLHWFKAV